MTMARLKKQEIGNAAGIYNLMRNIGGSIGIATVTTMLVRGAQAHQNYLAANLTSTSAQAQTLLPGLAARFAMGGASAASAQQLASGALYRLTLQQASLMAYADNFRLLGFLALICIPPVILLRKPKRRPLAGTGTAEK
jgi:DHA2 family multidrug resistance protein